ncbi:MAG: SDR family NAD(P)-dependent oxidoreductase, partial [Acidimicrobiales bacterium]
CQQRAPESRLWIADLADLSAAERVAGEAWEAFGHLDVVVNNAGIPKRRWVADLTADEVEYVLRVNYLSPVRMSLAILPRMLERNRGMIVNVSSLAGRLGVPHEAAYCGSKFALCGWSEAAAIDLHGTGVEVRLVNPGAIDTEIWDLPDNEAPVYQGPKEPAGVVADAIVAAIEADRFETYVPDLKAVVEFKASNIDAFLGGAANFAAQP